MIFDKVQSMLAEQMHTPKSKINLQSRIVEDLGADSLDIIEMLMSLEEKFKLNVPDEDALSLKTVQDIVKFIEKQQK